MQAIIVIGDKTSHGGTVITCSSTCDTHGKGWARIGDKVSCPRCKGIFPIVQGDATLTDEGMAVAYHGCKVACGATLIATQQFTFTRPAKGGASGAGGDAGAAQAPRSGMTGPIGSGWRPPMKTNRCQASVSGVASSWSMAPPANPWPEGRAAYARPAVNTS